MIPESTRAIPFFRFLLFVSLFFTALIPVVNAQAQTDAMKVLTPEELSWIEHHPRFTIGSFPIAPYNINNNETFSGFSIDLLQAVSRQVGLDPVFRAETIGTFPDSIRNGYIDIVASLPYSVERDAYLEYSEAFEYVTYWIYAHSNRTDITDLASLKKKTIAVTSGNIMNKLYAKHLPEATFIEVQHLEEMFRLVSEGKADATIHERISSEYQIRKNHFSNVHSKGAADFGDHPSLRGHYYAASEKLPLLKSILDKSFRVLPHAEKQRIWNKWFHTGEQHVTRLLPLSQEERAWLQDHPVIRVYVSNAPPYHFWDKGPKGISIDFLNLIAERAGLKIEYLTGDMDCAEALESIHNHKKVDLLPTAQRTTERDDFLLFSQNYLKLPWVIFTRQDEKNIFALEDLSGKSIAIEKGLFLQERLANEFPEIRQKLVHSVSDALASLSESQVDAYVGNLTIAQYFIAHEGFTNLKVVAPVELGHNTLAFAMRDDWPQLASILNKGLDAITAGERSAINRKYFTVEVTQSVDYTHLKSFLLIIATIVVSILASNTFLRRKVAKRTADLQKELERRRTSEALYRRLVDSLGNDFILFTLDRKGLLTYVSPSVSDMLGFAPEDAIGRHYTTFHTNSPVNKQAIANTEAGLRGERLPPFETELRHKDGKLIIVETTERPIFDAQGHVIALEGVVHNITGRKEVEHELQQHQEQLEELVEKRTDQLRTLFSAVEQSHSTIVITDLEGKIEYVNPAFTRTTGYSAEEALGKNDICKLNSSSHDSDVFQELWAALSAGKVWQGEICSTHKDGSLYWELANISPVRDKEGNITHYVAVKEDFTVRKKTELALEESRKQLALILEAANLGSWDWRPQSNELFTNDIFLTILGYAADTNFPMTLERWKSLIHPDDLMQSMEIIQPFLDGNDDYYRFEHRLLGADGQWKWMLDVGRVISRDSKRKALRFVGVHIDITEQKHIENLLIEAQQQAESANRQKSMFLANMSHEIRTPMNALIGLSELTLETDLTEQQHDYLNKIHTSSKGLLTIINDILDYATIEMTGSIILKNEDFSLPQIIHEIEGLFINQANQKELGLRFLIDPTITKILHGDASRLRQVLINLIGNALKFTNQGTITCRVFLLDQTEKHVQLKFTVLDYGIGIPADKLSILFKPFSQVDASYTRKYGGTGLGLAISRKFVEMMGGELTVQSEKGHGSEFSFTLNLAKTDKKDLRCTTPHDEHVWEIPQYNWGGKDVSILLVEDNDINKLVATEILTKGNFQVKAVENGKEAVAAFKSSLRDNTPFSVILMDIQMPILDGYTATTQIRELEATQTESPLHIPIIAMTAHAMASDREKSITAGMDAFISKPIDRSNLFKTLAKFITRQVIEKPDPSRCVDSSITRNFSEEIMLPDTLPGIDLVKGIAQLEGNRELYLRLLKEFMDQFYESNVEIEKMLEQNKADSARQIIHTVKGVAGNLSTHNLQDTAIELETALIEGNSVENILTRYAFAWQELSESIESLENKINTSTQRELPVQPGNQDIVSRLYSNLLKQLDTMDYQATTDWQELKPYLQRYNEAKKVNEIDRCIAILDFKNAAKLLKCFDEKSLLTYSNSK